MHRFEFLVNGVCDEACLCFGVGSPEEKDDGGGLFVEFTDNSVGEKFPTFSLVRVGCALPYGENGVEHKNTLICPGGEFAVRGWCYADI